MNKTIKHLVKSSFGINKQLREQYNNKFFLYLNDNDYDLEDELKLRNKYKKR